MSVSDNASYNDEAPVSRVVDEETACTLEGHSAAVPHAKIYPCLSESCSVIFKATKVAEYNAARHELMQFGQRYPSISSGKASLHAWRNIPQVNIMVKPAAGTLYTIDAGIIRPNNTGDGDTVSWRRGVAVAYLQHRGALVCNTAMFEGMLSGDIPSKAADELKLIERRLDTFGHDLTDVLRAQGGCYIDSWQPVPPSESLPGDEFPKVIQARKVAVGQALLA